MAEQIKSLRDMTPAEQEAWGRKKAYVLTFEKRRTALLEAATCGAAPALKALLKETNGEIYRTATFSGDGWDKNRRCLLDALEIAVTHGHQAACVTLMKACRGKRVGDDELAYVIVHKAPDVQHVQFLATIFTTINFTDKDTVVALVSQSLQRSNEYFDFMVRTVVKAGGETATQILSDFLSRLAARNAGSQLRIMLDAGAPAELAEGQAIVTAVHHGAAEAFVLLTERATHLHRFRESLISRIIEQPHDKELLQRLERLLGKETSAPAPAPADAAFETVSVTHQEGDLRVTVVFNFTLQQQQTITENASAHTSAVTIEPFAKLPRAALDWAAAAYKQKYDREAVLPPRPLNLKPGV